MPAAAEIVPVYYQSEFCHGVDSAWRVQFPAKWRQKDRVQTFNLLLWTEDSEGRDPDKRLCLMGLPPERWLALVAKVDAMKLSDPEALALRRLVGRSSFSVSLDGAGRINLSEPLARAVGIEEQAMFVGMVTVFQIWNPERYRRVKPMDTQMGPLVYSKL